MFKIISSDNSIVNDIELNSNFEFLKGQPGSIIAHFETFNYGKQLFLKNLNKLNKTVSQNYNPFVSEDDIICFQNNKTINEFHISFNSNPEKIKFYQRFNFLCNISSYSIFHLIENDLKGKNNEFDEFIKLFFKTKIDKNNNSELLNEKIFFLVYRSENEKSNIDLKKKLKQKLADLWKDCARNNFSFNNKTELMDFDDFKIEILEIPLIQEEREENLKEIENLMDELSTENEKINNLDLIEVSEKNKPRVSKKVVELWNSCKVRFLVPEQIQSGLIQENLEPTYQSELLFNNLWKFSCNVIRKWNKSVNRGRIIENFGQKVSVFLNELISEFDKSLPENYREKKEFLVKIQKLSDMLKQRVTSIFTKQILILQTQALDKYKDSLLKSISINEKDFEMERKLISERIDNWFNENAKKIVVPEIGLNISGAREELRSVMIEFAEKFKESPAVKLHAMQKLEKQTSSSGLKQSGVVIGFGLTAAVRPRGYGNLQFVSSYSHGPHVLNFSLVNDRDVAEQEGQTKVKPIRIQPSLNFDVDL